MTVFFLFARWHNCFSTVVSQKWGAIMNVCTESIWLCCYAGVICLFKIILHNCCLNKQFVFCSLNCIFFPSVAQTPSFTPRLTLHNPYTFYWTAPSPPKNCPFPWGDPDPHPIHGYYGPPYHTCQTASRSVQPFCYNTGPWPTHRQTMNIASNRSRISTFGWQPGPKKSKEVQCDILL